jgi:hypothetical protein
MRNLALSMVGEKILSSSKLYKLSFAEGGRSGDETLLPT